MRPIVVTATGEVPETPERIVARVMDVAQWTSFSGYGPLPGIREARFVERHEGLTGSRIEVVNTDGSRHTETVVEAELPHRLALRLDGFSPPLVHLASHFREDWAFEARGATTFVARSMTLYARGPVRRLLLWLISRLLQAALRRHLQEMATRASSAESTDNLS